ncbi:hypothetical protein EK21DRAFT_117480 [Setomelanomma holmii]|uniref:Uncharacterized protein n=1 Tax=Setomelanomma holmii TaxID=210430 RepID=A0A9P4H0Y9_9PLEO|nr:hypothetical protein EK21DRAFT_117480 [Setomelanomma holmii]
MSIQALGEDELRRRKLRSSSHGPPVPPKHQNNPDLSRPGQQPPVPPPEQHERHKPLPPAPRATYFLEQFDLKPLPPPPASVSIRTTTLWIAGFVLWFVLIVVLLPVITEKDAMPSFKRWLRSVWS